MNSWFFEFYKNKKVLVTGHTGFKGSWLSLWLAELGAEVIGYALEPYTQHDNFVVTGLRDKMIDIRGDIRDLDRMKEVFEQYKPEIVFHLAAQPLVRLSYQKPRDTYEINVMGTLNVLECIRRSESVKSGIMITTDKCYENREQIWGYRENDPMGGYDPYSSSKGCAELLIASYRNSYMNPLDYKNHGKAISSVRAGNVIGGGDWSQDRIVPDCIRALISDKPVGIRNPHAIRPWQHVLEPLSGYLLLAQKMYIDGADFSSAWNFGPDFDSNVTVKAVVDNIIHEWGQGKWLDLSNAGAYHEASLLSLDCTKARKFLGWAPRWKLNETIKHTVNWYKDFMEKDAYSLCKGQIVEYQTYINKECEMMV